MRASTLALLLLSSLAAGCPLEPLVDPGCTIAKCDDGNPCTDDVCDTVTRNCRFDPLAPESSCETDGNACNGVDRCDGNGACKKGVAPVLDDKNDCTTDACDPLTGLVSHKPIANCLMHWRPLTVAGSPSARTLHTAVWTGSKMIVWGGRTAGNMVTNTGAVYDPVLDSWSATNLQGAPGARYGHVAVWTGAEMIVWGGYGVSAFESSGARYDPARDVWTALPSVAIKGRVKHSGVWTGGEMIVWGGSDTAGPLGDGARYSPGSNSWSTVPAGGPPGRMQPASVWTGAAMLVWGGTDTFDWFDTGKLYNPVAATWSNIATANAPSLREDPVFAWTGSKMIVWGGWGGGDADTYRKDGGELNPAVGAGGTWTALASMGAPSARAQAVSVWTGSELCVWGGCGGDLCADVRDDGGCYSVASAKWRAIPADTAFTGRFDTASVWTGTEMIVFGGDRKGVPLAGGARLALATVPK
jgi:N-acetylneuraminic acid mutarotase